MFSKNVLKKSITYSIHGRFLQYRAGRSTIGLIWYSTSFGLIVLKVSATSARLQDVLGSSPSKCLIFFHFWYRATGTHYWAGPGRSPPVRLVGNMSQNATYRRSPLGAVQNDALPSGWASQYGLRSLASSPCLFVSFV